MGVMYLYFIKSSFRTHKQYLETANPKSVTKLISCVKLLSMHQYTQGKVAMDTLKNNSHNFSNGSFPGVRNIKAIFGFLGMKAGVERICLKTTRAAVSASVSSRVGSEGNQSLTG